MKELTTIENIVQNREKIIMMEELNCKIGRRRHSDIVAIFRKDETYSVIRLTDLFDQFSLNVLIKWFFQHKGIHKYINYKVLEGIN